MDITRNRLAGQCFRHLRLDAGLTQVEVAARLGKTQSFVSKVENAERELSLVEAFPYARALGVSYQTLIGEVHAALVQAGIES